MILKNCNFILLIIFIFGKNSVNSTCTKKQTTVPIDTTTTTVPVETTTTTVPIDTTTTTVPIDTTTTTVPIDTTTTTVPVDTTTTTVPIDTTLPCDGCGTIDIVIKTSKPTTTTQSTAAPIPAATTPSTTQSTAAPTPAATTPSTTQSTAALTPATTTASTTLSKFTPGILTSSINPIQPTDLCVHYSGTKYNLIGAQAVFVSTQVVPTVKSDPVPCCQVCNENPKCSMYTYAINGRDQSKSVCKLYTLSNNLSYNFMYLDYLSRVNTITYVGFPYSYIHFN